MRLNPVMVRDLGNVETRRLNLWNLRGQTSAEAGPTASGPPQQFLRGAS
jgi:hypothetical protein